MLSLCTESRQIKAKKKKKRGKYAGRKMAAFKIVILKSNPGGGKKVG